MQVVNSGPMSEDNELSHGIMQAICAKQSIYSNTLFLPPEAMNEHCRLRNRGVDVRIMPSKRSDMALVQLASRSFIEHMLKSGVKVYFYQEGFLHSKLMVFDGSLTLMGSANFDARSFEQNFEVEAFIYDSKVGEEASAIFVDDQRLCEQLSLREWMRRPRINRFLESLLRLFAPLL